MIWPRDGNDRLLLTSEILWPKPMKRKLVQATIDICQVMLTDKNKGMLVKRAEIHDFATRCLAHHVLCCEKLRSFLRRHQDLACEYRQMRSHVEALDGVCLTRRFIQKSTSKHDLNKAHQDILDSTLATYNTKFRDSYDGEEEPEYWQSASLGVQPLHLLAPTLFASSQAIHSIAQVTVQGLLCTCRGPQSCGEAHEKGQGAC